MKQIKGILALALALVMLFAVSATAMAAQTYTITVKDGYKGETYTAYKIFDVTYTGSAYAYTITNSNEWFNHIVGSTAADATTGDYTLATYGIKLQKTTTAGLYNVVNAVDNTDPTEAQMAALAAELAKHTSGKTAAGTGKVDWVAGTDAYGETADVTINVNPDVPGYYFVTTTTGSLCALNTTDTNAEVKEKNNYPTIDKKESLTEGTVGNAISYTEQTVDMSIGDTVYFEIEVKDGKGTNGKIVVHDTQSGSLTLNAESIKVYKDGSEVDASNYTKTVTGLTDGCTFEVELKADFVAGLDTDEKVIIRYNAKLNKDAIIKSEETSTSYNYNKTHIEYGQQHSADIEVVQHTFKFQLVKDDTDKNVLTGAKFKMYDSATGTTPIGFIKSSDTYRHLDATESSATAGYTEEIDAGTPIFTGFGPKTYYFEETQAPVGYNPLTERASLTVSDNNMATLNSGKYSSGGLEVVNKTGTELPSTGGIGTRIFYIIGGILVAAAIVLLVTRRRMVDEA